MNKALHCKLGSGSSMPFLTKLGRASSIVVGTAPAAAGVAAGGGVADMELKCCNVAIVGLELGRAALRETRRPAFRTGQDAAVLI